MENLLIIGNGFDLAHGLKTSYTDFIKSIVETCIRSPQDPQNLIKIEDGINDYHTFINAIRGNRQYALLMVSRPNYANLIMKTLLKDVALQNWCDIEQKYFELLSHVARKGPNNYSSAKALNDDFELIKKELEEYLITQNNNNAIEGYKELLKCLMLGNSLILNFNYTNTIKQLYETEIRKRDVIHIHGELNNSENPMIFGYAANDAENASLIDKNDSEFLRNIKRFAYNKTRNESRLKEYLEKRTKIHVNILGHSIGISDNLILEQILNHKNVQSIRIFYYENYDSYFHSQTNMYRIMRNNDNFKKLINFQDSIRMPQISDSKEQNEKIKIFAQKITKEYIKENKSITGVYIA